jgi:hypothetical protein
MKRSIFRLSEMSRIEKTVFIVCFAAMFFVFLFDLTGFLENRISKIIFSVFLGIFAVNWIVILFLHRRK